MEIRAENLAVTRLLKTLFEHGNQVARNRGATQVDEADMTALAEGACAQVRQTHEGSYDPELKPDDKEREAAHRRTLAERQEEQTKSAFARASLRDAELASARCRDPGPMPRAQPVVVGCLIATVAMSVAPTVHDLAGDVEDALLAWICASAAGLVIGGAILGSVFFGAQPATQPGLRPMLKHTGLVGGVLIGCALGLVRAASAEGTTELLLVAGLTLLEVATVVVGERIARRLEHDRMEWRKTSTALALAQAEREARAAQVREIEARVQGLQGLIDRHHAYIEERAWRDFDIPSVEAAAMRAVRDGYASGAAQNRGWILGTERAVS